MLFNHLKSNGYIESVPEISQLDLIINQKIKRAKVGRVYEDKEVESILENMGERYRLAVLMARHMGMRKMEVLTREWKDVSFREGVVSTWSFKNKRWRKVPIPKKVMEPLKAFYSKHKDERFLFPMATNHDSHMSGQLFDKQWKQAQKRAGIEGWSDQNAARFHDLRHTFATQTSQENWPPMVACKILDMSLKEYERTYVHINDAEMVKWMNGVKRRD